MDKHKVEHQTPRSDEAVDIDIYVNGKQADSIIQNVLPNTEQKSANNS